MAAYLVVEIEVKDPAEFENYKQMLERPFFYTAANTSCAVGR